MMDSMCCCCPDFIGRLSDVGLSNVSAWRKIHNAGTYASNVVSVDLTPRIAFSSQANYITIDYRNKVIFTKRPVGGNQVLGRFNFDLTGGNTDLLTYSDVGGTDARGLCVDWLNGRIIYPKGISNTPGTFPPNVLGTASYEIHAVNYDGTGDAALYTLTLNQGGAQNTTLAGWPVWEPNSGYVFFAAHTSITRAVGATFDTNQYAYLNRINGDGTGFTPVAVYENTAEVSGDSAIRGITVCPQASLVIWVTMEEHYPDFSSTIYKINAANYDGTGRFTIYSTPYTNILSNCVVSNKEAKVYFLETVGSNLYWRRCGITAAATPETIFDDSQLAAILPANYSWAGNGTLLGCAREHVSSSYLGGAQGTWP